MFNCKSCNEEFRDGAQCSICLGHFDFNCAGVTETGYRRLGENRKSSWKCSTCKSTRAASPLPPPSKVTSAKSPTPPADLDVVLAELKHLSLQVAVLPGLQESIKSIKAELSSMKDVQSDMKPELQDIKSSIEFLDHRFGALSEKIVNMEKDIQSLMKTKNEVEHLQLRVQTLEGHIRENEQRSRINNIEIKGVPLSNSENLFNIVFKIGSHIKCPIPKEQINYVARVPMRNDNNNKTIIIAVHSRYVKDDFVAAAKKCTITAVDLGLQGATRIFVNDHLTLENKMLLNKTKALAKDRGFAFTWVKGCKIFVRKNPSSPVLAIKTESDLKKL